MRIAFVTAYPPSLVRVRAYAFVRELAREHEVTVVCACHTAREQADVAALRAQGVRVVAVRTPGWSAAAHATGALLLGESLQVAHGAATALRRAVGDLVATGAIDVVHAEHLRTIASVRDLPVPVVWDAVDCISQLYELGARHGATPMMRLIGRLEAQRARREEQLLLHSLRHVLVTTGRDRRALRRVWEETRSPELRRSDIAPWRAAAVHVVRNGVDLKYFIPGQWTRQANLLVLSGKMSFHANVAAAELLAHEIMPRIWERRPDVRLLIAGSDPPRAVQALGADPRIAVTGYLSDLRPALAGAAIAVSPTPYAVGVQNKVLEALALGTPVVAMPAAVGGLSAIAGRDLLVAGTAHSFARTVVELLDDAYQRAALAHAGRQYVERYHSWSGAGRQLAQVYALAIAACQHGRLDAAG
ncbi:MAG TPA: glycosyltransferase family 4 protein [Ktedonobacterales bacterium]|jgi:glycosyltransferase involved in cell wall biosynthesis|nr:glycosyltransferase family 4 protein [Ktedonobacterales bacterium]